MKKLQSMDELFKGRHFEWEIIVLCVRWYLRYKLSLRDLVEMMAERGLALAHTTIMRWVQRFVPEFEKRWNRVAAQAESEGPRLPTRAGRPEPTAPPTVAGTAAPNPRRRQCRRRSDATGGHAALEHEDDLGRRREQAVAQETIQLRACVPAP